LTPKKTYLVIAAIWLFAILYESLYIPQTDILDGYCSPLGVPISAVVSGIVEWLATLPVEYLGPSLTMAFCYARMYCVLKRKVGNVMFLLIIQIIMLISLIIMRMMIIIIIL